MSISKRLLLRINIAIPILAIAVQPLVAETDSDSGRLEKLERAVQQLQQRNTQLEQEVHSLKKELAAAPAPPAAGPSYDAQGNKKPLVTYDGKTYVEKPAPVEKTAADKWKLSTPLTELELYGDARLRYEYRGGRRPDDTSNPSDWYERERERYRLRIGLRGKVLDDWFFGVRLETSTNPRSTNVTFGDDSSSGPFAKSSDGINVGQAYIGYKGFPDITLIGGKMPQPLVNTRMVWDDDINPEGLAEQWKHTFAFGGGEETAPSYSKDEKNLTPLKPAEPFLKLDLFANFAQFVYDDANPENPIGHRSTTGANGGTQLVPNTDAFLLAWQVGARLNFQHNLYFQFAPTLYNYTGNGDTFNVHFIGGDPMISNSASLAENQTGINSLLIYDMPWEFGWKINKLPLRVFGDFAVNFDGDDRAMAAGFPGKDDQRYAYQVGAGIGQLKKKKDWQVDAWWQHSEQVLARSKPHRLRPV